MDQNKLDALKYPVGKFKKPSSFDKSQINGCITILESFPAKLEALVNTLNIDELNLIYRPNGWKIKQVVHHVSDSHLNSIVRFKKTLTEDHPTISPYREAKWAELIDSQDDDISHSINIIKSVHHKWVILLKSMKNSDFAKKFHHPENGYDYDLNTLTALYSWHSSHHLGHIKQALEHRGSFEL